MRYSIVDLGTLGGQHSWATGVNDSGQVIGMSLLTDGSYRGFRTAPNSPINPAAVIADHTVSTILVR